MPCPSEAVFGADVTCCPRIRTASVSCRSPAISAADRSSGLVFLWFFGLPPGTCQGLRRTGASTRMPPICGRLACERGVTCVCKTLCVLLADLSRFSLQIAALLGSCRRPCCNSRSVLLPDPIAHTCNACTTSGSLISRVVLFLLSGVVCIESDHHEKELE